MDQRQREQLLAQIPTTSLRSEAFEKLGDDASVALMFEYQYQLEQIRANAETQVPVRRIYARAALIGALAGAGLGGLAFLSGREDVANSSFEAIQGGIVFLAGGAAFGGIMGLALGGCTSVEQAKRIFIRQGEKSVLAEHRTFLEKRLTDDQVTDLFLQSAAEE
ncbi:hypothetical protein HYU89_01595 [Candidatus Collierbacteria bacterium]|nr:hypothetical protein [Candidatus Collierbacteria bacterium]